MDVDPALVAWLANGERGVSSDTMVAHLTGIEATGRHGWTSHPRDPDDLGRCRKLLERVPALVAELPRMRTCSPAWAALVGSWQELCTLMDDEVPGWRDGHGWAPRTYARMKELEAPGGGDIVGMYPKPTLASSIVTPE